MLTLTVASLVVGWALATIGAAVRSSLQLTWQRTQALVKKRGAVGVANLRVVSTLAVALLLVVTTASLAALINYSPDALFHLGSGNFGLFTNDGTPTGTPRPGQSQSPSGPKPTPYRSLVPGPSAPGRMVETQLPAPWTGGTTDTITVSVYLPGDYDTSAESYPVMYFVPWTFKMWDDGAGIERILDGLISSGQIPPTIAVFASTDGGPFVDSECVDSFDGAELMETYLSDTLPAWVDGNYRTLRDPQHRALLGLSQGGFCATMLLLRHPDVFRQAASFGGYYTAGIKSGQTNNAWRPFGPAGGAQNRIADHSPILLARLVPPEQRSDLFMYVTGSPDQPFYGDQYTAFKTELAGDGIPAQMVDTPVAHSWTAVKVALPDALSAIAAAQAAASAAAASASPAPQRSVAPSPSPSSSPPPTVQSPRPTATATPSPTSHSQTPVPSITPSRHAVTLSGPAPAGSQLRPGRQRHPGPQLRPGRQRHPGRSSVRVANAIRVRSSVRVANAIRVRSSVRFASAIRVRSSVRFASARRIDRVHGRAGPSPSLQDRHAARSAHHGPVAGRQLADPGRRRWARHAGPGGADAAGSPGRGCSLVCRGCSDGIDPGHRSGPPQDVVGAGRRDGLQRGCTGPRRGA